MDCILYSPFSCRSTQCIQLLVFRTLFYTKEAFISTASVLDPPTGGRSGKKTNISTDGDDTVKKLGFSIYR